MKHYWHFIGIREIQKKNVKEQTKNRYLHANNHYLQAKLNSPNISA